MFKLPKAKAGNEWTEWKSGECPFPTGTRVDVIYRNGNKKSLVISLYNAFCSWVHMGRNDDIVAYRLSWIRHRGGKHPGKSGDKFVGRFRNGWVVTAFIMDNDRDNNITWLHFNNPYDIMAYKPVL